MSIRRILTVFACCLPAFAVSKVLAETSCALPFDVTARYGDRIAFDVIREGSKVGVHETRFDREGEFLKVTSAMKLKVKVLFIPVYKFRYNSEGLWCGNSIHALKAEVNDNGDRNSIVAARKADKLVIGDGQAALTVTDDVLPTNHWNPAILDDNTVLNTLTGNLNNVEIIKRDPEMVETRNGQIRATRYEYQGDLETEAWYDDEGRWVKLRFEAKDGSTIEYVCTSCAAGTGKS